MKSPPSIGSEIVRRLRHFRRVLESGERITDHFRVTRLQRDEFGQLMEIFRAEHRAAEPTETAEHSTAEQQP